MKLNEILTADNGIFSTFNEWNATLYTKWFTDTAAHYDNYVLYSFGGRTASKWFEANKDEISVALNMVFAACVNSWERVFDALTAEYSVASPYSYKETESGTSKSNATATGKIINSEKPYNASEFVGTEQTDNDTGNNATSEHTTTKERTGNNGGDVSVRIRKELELRKSKFTDIFIKDIINYIGLSVYE